MMLILVVWNYAQAWIMAVSYVSQRQLHELLVKSILLLFNGVDIGHHHSFIKLAVIDQLRLRLVVSPESLTDLTHLLVKEAWFAYNLPQHVQEWIFGLTNLKFYWLLQYLHHDHINASLASETV